MLVPLRGAPTIKIGFLIVLCIVINFPGYRPGALKIMTAVCLTRRFRDLFPLATAFAENYMKPRLVSIWQYPPFRYPKLPIPVFQYISIQLGRSWDGENYPQHVLLILSQFYSNIRVYGFRCQDSILWRLRPDT